LAFESAATIVEADIAVHAMFMASAGSPKSAANARFRRTPIFMGCCTAPAWPM
jgi:hypothetical protein